VTPNLVEQTLFVTITIIERSAVVKMAMLGNPQEIVIDLQPLECVNTMRTARQTSFVIGSIEYAYLLVCLTLAEGMQSVLWRIGKPNVNVLQGLKGIRTTLVTDVSYCELKKKKINIAKFIFFKKNVIPFL